MNKLGIHETAGLTRYAMGLNPHSAKNQASMSIRGGRAEKNILGDR